LGWDVNHEIQKNPYEQEVRIENAVRTGASQRRADYGFYLSPNFRDPKFFVEAKKPSRSIANPDDYFQVNRYGWSQQTPVAVLTDFEELHIIDCRFKPHIGTALDRKIKAFRYTDYTDAEKFAEIYWLFSREAVATGSLEKYAAALPRPKGKAAQKGLFKAGVQPIDEAFLEELDEYRVILAKAFKKSNPDLEGEALTEAVQRTIDRLVFIRFLEDKSIEDYEVRHYGDSGHAWKKFLAHCQRLEPKYNGLVFKPHPVIDGRSFHAPDEEDFKAICAKLSDPHAVYDFDQIPIAILGSIYERFLGKVVHTTAKRAVVEEKPEVRKAGGVYYTPEYIVRYIVQNTVGKLIEGKTPESIAKMAFADIACGSGSFLIEVYSELLAYHEKYYLDHPEAAKAGDTQLRDGRIVLSLKKRQEILINNIYGVDIDFQATEVTQLSLYLKLLEDATRNDAYQYGMLKEKVLPDLKKNIVCGNSLIGTDILEGDLFERTEEKKLKPMDFESAFPEIMKRGGFDAIVGNPPYGAVFAEVEKKYIQNLYKSYKYKFDSYIYFIEKGITLIKQGGFLGYITPELWLHLENCAPLRKFVTETISVDRIKICGENVFSQAVVNTVVPIFSKVRKSKKILIEREEDTWEIDSDGIDSNNNYVFNYRLKPLESHLILKIKEKRATDLASLGDAIQGITPYDRYAGQDTDIIKNRAYHFKTKKDKFCEKWIDGQDVSRYALGWSGEWLRYGKWLAAPRDPKFFNGKRLLFREVPGQQKRIQATLALETLYHGHSITPFKLFDETKYDHCYILGITNSKLLSWYGGLILPNFGKNIFPKLNPQDIKTLPIRTINFSDPSDKSRHDHIVKLVEQMLSTKEKLASAKLESERDRLEMMCEALDRQIDDAVYQLYGLTEEEIKIVEGK
ncbi:MAG TPA: N-6 DNA methylase, partial [bacterium]|nr:N-6 DNA methylase [bacterium]